MGVGACSGMGQKTDRSGLRGPARGDADLEGLLVKSRNKGSAGRCSCQSRLGCRYLDICDMDGSKNLILTIKAADSRYFGGSWSAAGG